MGCCGDREKGKTVAEDQKWDYINLSDFKSTSCLAPLSYGWLWILVIISCAIYAADAFTAVNLLAFNNWSSTVKPKVPFEVAKWIFAITIIISYVFLLYRWIMALRVMRTGSVTECYLEPLAAILQSMRITKRGQGWRRFLVFAELTKSKKGANYIALFVYFQFKGALIIVLAQGPRIAINAMTLYAVMQAQLIPGGDHAAEDRSNFEQFFFNIKVMVEQGNKQETIVYFTMLFSLVIWVIAALSLIISALLYIFFLWHYIPRADGSLTNYCRRKLETRLERIVGKKVKKAIEKQDQQRRKEEQKAIKKGTLDPSQTRPTLPKLGGDDDDTSTVFSLQRSDTMSTSATAPPPYTSNGPTRSNTMNTMNTNRTMMKPSLPSLGERPDMPTRSNTQFSNFSTTSYGSNAPLLNQSGSMGMPAPAPAMPPMDRNGDYFGERPMRPYAASTRPYSPMSQGRASPMPARGPMPPVDTSYMNNGYESDPYLVTPLSNDTRTPASAQSNRPYPEFSPFDSRGPQMGPSYELSPVDTTPTSNIAQHYYSNSNDSNEYNQPPQLPSALRAGSPALSQPAGLPSQPRAGTAPPRSGTAPPRPGLPASLQSAIQRREASQPFPNRGMNSSTPQQRSATAPIQQPSWNSAPPQRSYTPSERSYTPAAPSQRGYDNNNNNGNSNNYYN
ncbi:Potassium transporter [Coniothyrium glycines]